MNCIQCNDTGYIELFSCCKGFEDIFNNECCGMSYSTEEICKCGIIKSYQIIYMHSNGYAVRIPTKMGHSFEP